MNETITFIIGVLVGFLAYGVFNWWINRSAFGRLAEIERVAAEATAVYEECVAADECGDRAGFERLKHRHRALLDELERL